MPSSIGTRTMARAKISIIGAGNVGAACAHRAASKDLGDIVLVDIPEKADVAAGKALDLLCAGPIERFDGRITGTDDYGAVAGSDVVIVTAGIPRTPGMSRDDLIATNVRIVKSVAERVAEHAPETVMIVVSNPLDAMVYTAWKASGFATSRIVGQAGCLDVARFRAFLARELDVSVQDIQALLLGGHGDDMVPLARYASVHGIPVTQLLPTETIDACIERAKMGGGEIVKMMGTSAYEAPAAGSIQMAEAIIRDTNRILPCAAYCDGEFGIDGLFVGVPAVLGAGGVTRVVEVELDEGEQSMLDASAQHVADLVEIVRTTFPELT